MKSSGQTDHWFQHQPTKSKMPTASGTKAKATSDTRTERPFLTIPALVPNLFNKHIHISIIIQKCGEV